MSVFFDREASPREIAAELGEPINNVTYHVKQLVDLKWIELVTSRPAHGGRVVEHFYKAIKDSYFDEVEWEHLGEREQLLVSTTIMSLISKDVGEAMLAGTFFEREDNHLTRIPIEVDAEGWEETKEILERALGELLAVREATANRVATSGESTYPTKVEIIHFRSPQPETVGDSPARG
jgi:DNA-binding MarR family transcriptional regulator